MKYNTEEFQYGAELEFGDINKKRCDSILPKELGSFEWCEGDILNLREPYYGIAGDPEGINPPVGGEINTVPTVGWQAQHDKIFSIVDFLVEHGEEPTISHRCHSHIHIHVPSLIDDVDALRRLGAYVYDNQETLFNLVYPYDMNVLPRTTVEDLFGVKEIILEPTKEAKRYLKTDGAKLMPEWVRDRLVVCTDFEDFYRSFMSGESRRGMPIRYGVNLYCLKHTKTIEFRCFRGTLDKEKYANCFMLVEEFINAALNTGEPLESIIERRDWKYEDFPEMRYDHEAQKIFEQTKKHGDFIKGKQRKFVEL